MCITTSKSVDSETASASVKQGDELGNGPSVVLIGCGPGGMALLHALELRKQTLDPTSSEYAALPTITCYERGPAPGGVWREVPEDDRERKRPENYKLQYEDLWLNNPKEMIEYFDYTFDEHFQCQTPSFLPRRDILNYIVARNNRLGALNHVRYNHNVENVKYDVTLKKFITTVRDYANDVPIVQEFDKCIWACGMNGEAKKPKKLFRLLSKFAGVHYHAVEATERFPKDVRGKRLLLIGSSNSAEDLALRAIKHGVEHVYVSSRSGEGAASIMGSWPQKKVTVVRGSPSALIGDRSFEFVNDCGPDDVDNVTKVNDIDVVILCTGYDNNQSMLHEELRFNDLERWKVNKDWSMKKNHQTESLGDVTPYKKLWGSYMLPYASLYDGMLISNPNMAFMFEVSHGHAPIFTMEVHAWLYISYLSGKIPIPSKEDMTKYNIDFLTECMQHPFARMEMDENYWEEWNEMKHTEEGKWLADYRDDRMIQMEQEYGEIETKWLAEMMQRSGYPLDFGNSEELSPVGRKYMPIWTMAQRARTTLSQIEDCGAACTRRSGLGGSIKLGDDDVEKNTNVSDVGMTFRDLFTEHYVSLITGTPSVPLPGKWLNLVVDKEKGEPTTIMNLKDRAK